MNNLNMRRILKKPTLRMEDGGVQIPQGPGMDRAGMLERNPGVAANYSASPSPGALTAPTPSAAPATPTYSMAATTTPEMLAAAGSALKSNIAGFESQTANLQKMNGTAPVAAPVVDPTAAAASAQHLKDQKMSMAMGLLNSHQNLPVTQITQSGAITMADGGQVSPWSLRGMSNAISGALAPTPESIQKQRDLEAYRANSAAAAKAAPQPAAQPAPQTAAPMGNQSVIDGRMKAAGLREGGSVAIDHGHGGKVPGHGKGDKIPAKYEPGEFVVSNDMLKAKPSLRGELRELRKKVLAKKGMTPAQADAKAVSGGSLRAYEGWPSQGIPDQNPKVMVPVVPGRTQEDFLRDNPGIKANRAASPSPGMAVLPYQDTGSAIEERKIAAANSGATDSAFNKTVADAAVVAKNAQSPTGGTDPVLRRAWRDKAFAEATARAKIEAAQANRAQARLAARDDIRETLGAEKAMSKEVRARLARDDTSGAVGATLRGFGNVATGWAQDSGRGVLSTVTGDSKVARFSRGLFGMDEPTKDVAGSAPKVAPAQPSQASYSNEGRNHPTEVVTPKTLRGPDGREYLEGAVTQADRTRSEDLINAAFGNRGKSGLPGEENMNMLRNNAASMDMYNQGLAAKGSGIKASIDANGQLRLEGSTTPEKMQYIDTKGNPTSEYRNTQQYAEGIAVAKRDKALADKMEQDRLVQEAGSHNAAYALPAQRALAQRATLNNQAIEQDKTQALRDGNQIEYNARVAPTQLAMKKLELFQGLSTKHTDPKTGEVNDNGLADDLSRAGLHDEAEKVRKNITDKQAQVKGRNDITKENAAQTRALFNGMNNYEKDGVIHENKAMDDSSHALALQMFPGFDTYPIAKQQELMPKIRGTLGLARKLGNVERGGFAGDLPNWMSGQKSFAPTLQLRGDDFFKGATREAPFTGTEGLFARTYEKGDTRLKLPGGQGYARIPQMTAEEQAVLDERTGQKF